jgi:hypothetical protein
VLAHRSAQRARSLSVATSIASQREVAIAAERIGKEWVSLDRAPKHAALAATIEPLAHSRRITWHRSRTRLWPIIVKREVDAKATSSRIIAARLEASAVQVACIPVDLDDGGTPSTRASLGDARIRSPRECARSPEALLLECAVRGAVCRRVELGIECAVAVVLHGCGATAKRHCDRAQSSERRPCCVALRVCSMRAHALKFATLRGAGPASRSSRRSCSRIGPFASPLSLRPVLSRCDRHATLRDAFASVFAGASDGRSATSTEQARDDAQRDPRSARRVRGRSRRAAL